MWLIQNIRFCFDPLTLFFLALIGVVSLPSMIFSVGYLKGHFSKKRIKYAAILAFAFIASMLILVSAANALLFLFAWELMSLLSFFFVVFEYEHEHSIKAGILYLIMAHIGTACLLAALLLFFKHAGSFDFQAIRISCGTIPLGMQHAIFLLLLFGFGVKAAIVPLHLWLPYAHPQAPSHISSIMSGVMIKTALYGLLRFVIGILGVQASWWGVLIIVLASISCFVGVMYALVERDLKRILAYSSVENMGIIFLGLGATMVLVHAGLGILASCVLVATLYQAFNHAVFKGLLFLCSGSVYNATGARDIEKMGGLIKRMPWTSGAFLVGAMGIAALPPFNGFVSEWLLFQSFFTGMQAVGVSQKLMFGLMITVLALTSGLAAACFVRLFGITFLAVPRSRRAQEAQETAASMKFATVGLASLVIVLGLAAGGVWRLLTVISNDFLRLPNAEMPLPGVLNTPLLAVVLVATGLATFGFVSICKGKARRIIGKTWDCGYYRLDARNEYTATAFSKPLRIAFSFFLRPYRKAEKIRESYYYVSSFKYALHTKAVFKEYLYRPVVAGFFKLAHSAKVLQMGNINWYLGYILIVLLGVIIVSARCKL